jgi:error-prone DNA polymerase
MPDDSGFSYEFLAYPKTRKAYGCLTSMLSAAKMRTLNGAWQEKDVCDLTLQMIAHYVGNDSNEMILIALPSRELDDFSRALPLLCKTLPCLSHLAATLQYQCGDRERINKIHSLANDCGLKVVATNDVHYHESDRRQLVDAMTCIREGFCIHEAGSLLNQNAERYMKSPTEMALLFREWPLAIQETRSIVAEIQFDLGQLKYEYPNDPVPEGLDPQEYLSELVWQGAQWRYDGKIPNDVQSAISRELVLIKQKNIAKYFLTIHDIVDRARYKNILCQGRGSAANSAVCYCLGITSVDPAETDVLFERFISEDRNEPPDIDVDFEHERREEVIQDIYARYGRDRAGLCATVIHYRPRMAIREIGKVMGLSEDVTSALAKTVWGSWGLKVDEDKLVEAGLDLSDPLLARSIQLADQLIGMPRHLSQHVGGFILTERPLTETVPIGNGAMPDRSFIEWDKDDIDALGIFKMDVLALGMLTCIRKCFDLIAQHHGTRYTLATIPKHDPETFDMLCKGDSLGVFQVESRAQMNMLPRLRPRTFYDLVIEVAIVRPGPIQGDMVHPYLKRRRGNETVEYPSPAPEEGPQNELKDILERTLGVPIFQEQAMKIAMVAAEFSSREANQLRKAMATFRAKGKVSYHKEKMLGRMIKRGYDPKFAERCFSQIEGFGEYGFPESHAASFAKLVYVSSYLKCHYPAAFAAALLNSQPMGFYAPAQIIRDVQDHNVEVLSADVNLSEWNSTLETPSLAVAVDGKRVQPALRLGLRQIEGLKETDAAALLLKRGNRYDSVAALRDKAGLGVPVIERLAAADAFNSVGKNRRQALWDARALKNAPDLPLFTYARAADEGVDTEHALPKMPLSEEVVADYQTTRFSLKAHPMEFLREGYRKEGFTKAADLRGCAFDQRVSVSGIVLIRQRPGTAKGTVFITIEDETGVVNLIVWPDKLEQYRKTVMGARLMSVKGVVQMDEDVIHVIAHHLEDDTARLNSLSEDLLPADYARADHVVSPLPSNSGRHPRNVSVIPKSRDFH